jgi:hypothetical protein
METGHWLNLTTRRRWMVLMVLGALLLVVLAIKSVNREWFVPKTPIEVTGQPVLVFFSLAEGCECQMSVVQRAEAQLADWPCLQTGVFSLQRVDYDRRPELVRLYHVARAPAQVLLDASGVVVWTQDLGVSDKAPLDLEMAQRQIEDLVSGSTR